LLHNGIVQCRSAKLPQRTLDFTQACHTLP
jgi:hypothetical protein